MEKGKSRKEKPHKDKMIFMGVFAIPKNLKKLLENRTITYQDLAYCADSKTRNGVHTKELADQIKEGGNIRDPGVNISGIGNAAYFSMHSKDKIAAKKAQIFCDMLMKSPEGRKILLKCIEKGESDQKTMLAYMNKSKQFA